mgnify:FL=1
MRIIQIKEREKHVSQIKNVHTWLLNPVYISHGVFTGNLFFLAQYVSICLYNSKRARQSQILTTYQVAEKHKTKRHSLKVQLNTIKYS